MLTVASVFCSSFAFSQTWEPVGGGIQGGDSNIAAPVFTLCEYNGKLYAAGLITKAGSMLLNNMASWDGKQWDTLSIGTNAVVTAMAVYKNALCVGGGFSKAGRKKANNVAEWVDTSRTFQAWFPLGKGISRIEYYDNNGRPTQNLLDDYAISSLTEYKQELYALGYFSQTGDGVRVTRIAKWNGYKWNKVGKAMYLNSDYNTSAADSGGGGIGSDYNLSSAVVFNNELYACVGNIWFVSLAAKNNLFKWNGIKWENTAEGITDKNKLANQAGIWAMTVYDSALYVAGSFQLADGKPAHNIAKWDGKTWSVLGNGINIHGIIRSMVVCRGKLYIGGLFDSAGGKPAKSIACWDEHSWSAVGAGLSTGKYPAVANVNALCVYKGELYAAGSFTNSGGKPVMNIARLNLNGTKPNTKSKK